MYSPTGLKNFIRYQISILSESNNHHKFEDICRHLAKLRYCSNIIPATGPVSAKGDGGIDFPTFKTFLKEESSVNSAFYGLTSEKNIIFACSIQASSIETKIRADVKKIRTNFPKTDCIYFFSGVAVPIGYVNELKSELETDFDLVIIDANAISEELACSELFWIAEEFLGASRSLFPYLDSNLDPKYLEYKIKWIDEQTRVRGYSFIDFYEIQYGLRHATFNEDVRIDLSLWLQKAEEFFKNTESEKLKIKSCYEIAVAALRGQNNLDKYATYVEYFFTKYHEDYDIYLLSDAVVLYQYIYGAFQRSHFLINLEEMKSHYSKISDCVEELGSQGLSPFNKCFYLQMKLGLALNTFEDLTEEMSLMIENNIYRITLDLIKEAKSAPAFPFQKFQEIIDVYLDIFHQTDKFLDLSEKADEVMKDICSSEELAFRFKDRAIKLFDKGNLLSALEQLHKAKLEFYKSNNQKGILFSCSILATWYSELNMIYAAKYYSMVVIDVAHSLNDLSLKRFITTGTALLMDCFYKNAEWFKYQVLFDLWQNFRCLFNNEFTQKEDDEFYCKALYYSILIKKFLIKLGVDSDGITNYLELLKNNLYTDDFECLADDNLPIEKFGTQIEKTLDSIRDCEADDFHSLLNENFIDVPLREFANESQIRWKALGVEWCINSINSYEDRIIAEELACLLQIFLVNISKIDLAFLPTKVVLNVAQKPDKELSVDRDLGIDQVNINLSFKNNADPSENFYEKFSLMIMIVQQVSLLKEDNFYQFLNKEIVENISSQIIFGSSYTKIYKSLIQNHNHNIKSGNLFKTFPKFSLGEHEVLSWIDQEGPTYCREKSLDMIQQKYKTVKDIFKNFPKLSKEKQQFLCEWLEQKRGDGFKDWHLFQVIGNLIMNSYMSDAVNRLRKANVNPIEMQNTMSNIMQQLLQDIKINNNLFSKISESVINQEELDNYLRISYLTIANSWGLTIKKSTQDANDFQSLEKFMNIRYLLKTDDVEHDDYFLQFCVRDNI